jgi:hypothetical protein
MANKTKKRVKPTCHKHPDTELICPKCRAGTGGKTTAKKYSAAQLKEWGSRGGRPRKKESDAVEETTTGAADGAATKTAETTATA